jgi:hypothetical protein
MTASLSDILTTQKNGVIALNNISASNLRGQGTQTSATVTASTLVISGSGYLVNYAVVVAGSATGTINNASTTALAAAGNVLCATPATVGVYQTGQFFNAGLVIVPGTGQSINVTYSPG